MSESSLSDWAKVGAGIALISDNLNKIYANLHSEIETVYGGVEIVNDNLKVTYDKIELLAKDFSDFVELQKKANRLQIAETKLIKIRQELEQKYGHYDIVRRTTTGILQADDLGIVKSSTITNVTEELMITTPNYWLAPCLVALASWINDEPTIADRALKEAIKRDDEKTSLLFGLICNRANRKASCLKWMKRYLEIQDPENLNRETIVVLDAYTSGVFGPDSEGTISKQIEEWLLHLQEKDGFIEQQNQQWSNAILLKKKPIPEDEYPCLRKFSHTWSTLSDILEGANLHRTLLEYFEDIFNENESTDTLKQQLDDIVDNLVSNFDEQELPLRESEKLEQYIVDFDGDEDRAKRHMALEKTAFEAHKDFTQLLTDASMNPESSKSRISTQKFAISLSKEWIKEAYVDIVATNRSHIPDEIEINIDTFNDKTKDGSNEDELVFRFKKLIDKEYNDAIKQVKLSLFEEIGLFGGIIITILGIMMLFIGNSMAILIGLVFSVFGVVLTAKYAGKKKNERKRIEHLKKQFREKREKGLEILHALIAEIVDFRIEFEEKEIVSNKVLEFLNGISPDQYVKKMSDSTRRVKL